MKIHGLCTCVNYAQYLNITAHSWMRGLESLTIVTTPADKDTQNVARHIDGAVTLFATDIFTENNPGGFNKGAAMEEARRYMPWEDWILFFDVDVCPALGQWSDFKLGGNSLPRTHLYGAKRYQVWSLPQQGEAIMVESTDPVDDDRVGYGYFQLFHTDAHPDQRKPLLDTHWRHAGNYDSNFMLSWGDKVSDISAFLNLYHLGPKHENWFGVGRAEDFKKMQERRGGLGIHPSERLPD